MGGCIGYIETPRGYRTLKTIFAEHLTGTKQRRRPSAKHAANGKMKMVRSKLKETSTK